MFKLFVVLYSELQAKIESNMPRCVGGISSAKEFNLIHRSMISQYMNSFKYKLSRSCNSDVVLKQQQSLWLEQIRFII